MEEHARAILEHSWRVVDSESVAAAHRHIPLDDWCSAATAAAATAAAAAVASLNALNV